MLAVLTLLAGSKAFWLGLKFLYSGSVDSATGFLGWLALASVLSIFARA